MTPNQRIEEIRGNLPDESMGQHTIFGDARFLLDQLDAAKEREREWIPTSERLPLHRKDAGYFRCVLALWRPQYNMKEPVRIPYNNVGTRYYSHWARIPDPPEDKDA